MRLKALLLFLVVVPLLAQDAPVDKTPVFGTTVTIPSGLRGDIYFLHLHHGPKPGIERKEPKGSIYTTRLNVPPQDFKQGFPGVADRLEWFAIDYHGKFYVARAGNYRFRLLSDDGSELYVDGQRIIDNGGLHTPRAKDGAVCLATGVHQIRVLYFQGTRYEVALVLQVATPVEEKFRVFDTGDFKPPPGDPAEWPASDNGPCTKN